MDPKPLELERREDAVSVVHNNGNSKLDSHVDDFLHGTVLHQWYALSKHVMRSNYIDRQSVLEVRPTTPCIVRLESWH
jgi:hypothetical protein